MKMSGERVIPAPKARVWEALNDPDVLRQSVPGCQEMVKHSPTEFSAKVQAKVGPVKANFAGDVTLRDLDPPNSYRISGKGTGGAAGFAEGGADVRLEDLGGQTRLIYDVDAKVGGKLAQIGSRLIDSTARRMADDFFNRFAAAVGNDEPQPEFPSAVEPDEAIAQEPVSEPVQEPANGAARTAAAKKAPAKKSPARKTAAKKSAAKKPTRKSKAAEPSPEFATGEIAPPPSLMPEAAIAAPTPRPREEPRQAAPQQHSAPSNMSNASIWWVVGAGIAALVIILVLANF